MSGRTVDGRWICLGGLAVYLVWLLAAGPGPDYRARWQQLGVDARTMPFLDLHLFPAARAEFAAGGDPAVRNPGDPLARPYNYPSLWLRFMIYPAEPRAIATVAVGMAVAALLAVLAAWGRLAPGAGALAATLVCSPAVMLGVERGNTDLLVFSLVAAGLALGGDGVRWRRVMAGALWLAAAVLKLYPALAFAAWWRRDWRATARRLAVPGVLLAVWFGLHFAEIRGTLHATGHGALVSYGAAVPARALVLAAAYYAGTAPDLLMLRLAFTALALTLALAAVRAGVKLTLPPEGGTDEARIWRGFRAGAWIYLGTFLAGESFDYRLIFLLLTLPVLWHLAWHGPAAWLARGGLAALVLATWPNFLNGRWPGHILGEAGAWVLVPVFAALLAADWVRRPAVA